MLRLSLLLAGLALAICPSAHAQSESQEVLPVYLSVTYHGPGNGFPNTPGAAYSCGFDKSSYRINQAGMVNVRLLKSTDARFEIQSLRIDGDSAGDYQQRRVATREASFYAANQHAQAIYFTVFVGDLITGQVVECDPVIENIPE